jgi:hypothetical protein
MISPYLFLLTVTQPVIELPTDTSSTASIAIAVLADTSSTSDVLTRGMQEERFHAARTVIGSYGEFALEYLSVGPDTPFDGTATVRRLVLFVAHNFSDDFRGYVEAEWENAIACSTCNGSVEIEQAFVDWRVLGDDLSLRAGLVLVPMGIINQWHEPPVYHGVARPRFDQLVIPSTWRELGIGIYGTFLELGRYELYLMTPLDVVELGPAGLVNTRTIGSLTPMNGFMFTGRAEVEPLLGVVFGFSAVAGDLGGGNRFFREDMSPKSLNLPIFGFEADARWRRSGLEARVVAATFLLPESGALLTARRSDGSLYFPDPSASGVPPTRIAGAYAEVAYDVLRVFAETEHALLPFVRLEWYDTQSAVPDGYARDPRFGVVETTFGLTYRPIAQVVFKMDYALRDRRLGLDEKQLSFGFGYMF